MGQNICNICGANLEYKDGKWVCPACGAYKEEEISNEETTLLFNAAQILRLARFDEAEEKYRDIVAKYPKNSEGHWGLLLAKYGIKYEDDYDGKKLPTCYATSIESILTDKDYLDAVNLCADAKRKSWYITQANCLEKIRIEWLEKASKEPKYDVFLCYKDSDKINNFERTDDSIQVRDLYDHLKDLGYNVFYSRVSLKDKTGEKYEPYIYNALNTASVMVVYGSKAEYFTSTWMQNEWTRFYKRLKDGLKVEGSLVVACDGVNPNDLPKPLGTLQCIDAKSKSFYGELEKQINKVISIVNKPKATVERITIVSSVGKKKTSIENTIKTIKIDGKVASKKEITIKNDLPIRELGRYEIPVLSADENTKIKNIYRSIGIGDFANAKESVEEILLHNKFNGQALLAKLFIEYEAKNIVELSVNMKEINDFVLIQNVIDYNEKDKAEQVLTIICNLIKTNLNNSNYQIAMSYFKEIAIYNALVVNNLKDYIFSILEKLINEDPSLCQDLFDILLNTYQNQNKHLEYIHKFVTICLQNKQFDIAKKYNDRILELDDSNLDAIFSELFIEVKAINLDDFTKHAEFFNNFDYLDSAIHKLSRKDIDRCFKELINIFNSVRYYQKSGDILAKWLEFITQYEFEGRKDFIQNTLNNIGNIENVVSRTLVFDKIINCIDGKDIERHISLRLEFAEKLQLSGDFALAINYYKQVLDIEEDNLIALWNIILCLTESKKEIDIAENIDKFTSFNEIEMFLRYCPLERDRIFYLDKILDAIVQKSATISNKDYIIKLAKVFDGTIKYYPESGNIQLIQKILKFADNCKINSVFELAEKYYAMVLSLDKMQSVAYWGLLQAKLNCRNNDDLIRSAQNIVDLAEFKSACNAAGDDDRTVEKYYNVAKQQKEYKVQQEKIKLAHKKKYQRVKKLIKIICALMLIALLAFLGINFYVSEKGLKYSSYANGYEVKAGLFYKESNVIIPSEYNGKNVIRIKENAFKDNKNINTITIPSSITTVGSNAFKNCINLENITFVATTYHQYSTSGIFGTIRYLSSNTIETSNSKVTIVGDNAFDGCVSLESIDLSNVGIIGVQSFKNCSKLKAINLGSNLQTLSNQAFSGCLSLASLELPNQLKAIGNNCFENCVNLTSITIPASVETVGSSIFNGCNNLVNLIVSNRVDGLDTFDSHWKDGLPENTIVTIGFNIKLDYNGGFDDVLSIAVTQGESFELPVATRTGYKFLGWFDSLSNGQQICDENGQSLSVYENDESITLYALWEANINKLVFLANNGIGTMKEQEIATDATAMLNACTYTREGYTFIGWGLTKNSVSYEDQSAYQMGSKELNYLYAIWRANTNILNFDGNGATSGATSTMSVKTDKIITLNKNGYERTGYEFIGWSNTPNGTKIYNDEDDYKMGLDAEYTLYAVWNLKSYNISYALNGGSTSENNIDAYNIKSSSFALINPTKNGYEFIGWSGTGIDGTQKDVIIKTGTSGDLNFIANYEIITYSISYSLNGGTNNSNNPSSYTVADSINLLNPTKTGYTFVSWSPLSYISSGTTGNKVFVANWELEKYEIVYNLNGGVNNDINPVSYTIEQSVTLLEPTKKGYTFVGWSNGGIITKGSAGVKTFTATWSANTNTLKFDANGGTGTMSYLLVKSDQTITLSDNLFTRNGYTFAGWSTTSNGKVEYVNKATYTMGLDSTYMLYAIWNVINYSISYDYSNGTDAKNTSSYTIENNDITLINPTKSGYTFTGWTGTDLSEKTLSVTINHGSTGNKSYKANWKANTNTIIFNANGGAGSMSKQSIDTDSSANLIENQYTKVGYTFAGWSTNVNGTKAYDDKSLYKMGTNNNYDLYALWTPNNNTLIFDGNTCTSGSMDNITIATDATQELPANSYNKKGYTFIGWALTSDGEVEYSNQANYTMGVNSTYTLYAVWQANTYSISYDANSGTIFAYSKDVLYDNEYILDIPNRAGYDFSGWYVENEQLTDSTGRSLNKYLLDENITSVAHWSPKENVIILVNNGVKKTITGLSDSYISLPINDTVREGYVFEGWSDTDGGEITWYDRDLYYVGTKSSYTLYGVWNDWNAYTPISTFEELQNMSLTGKYYLKNDIDCSGKVFNTINGSFTGVLDGNGYSLNNLTIKATAPWTSYTDFTGYDNRQSWNYYSVGGIFGWNSGTISNLNISNFTFDLTDCTGGHYYSSSWIRVYSVALGAITAVNKGTIKNCRIFNSFSIETNKTYWFYIGMICGVNTGGNIEKCYVYDSTEISGVIYGKTGNTTYGGGWACGPNAYYGSICGENKNNGLIFSCNSYYNGVNKCIEQQGDYTSNLTINSICGYNDGTVSGCTYGSTDENVSSGANGTENNDISYYLGLNNSIYYVFGNKFEVRFSKGKQSQYLISNAFVNPGYTFIGWSLNNNSKKADFSPNELYTFAENETNVYLYPVWSANTQTISFTSNGGEGTMPSIEKKTGEEIIAPECLYVKAGYHCDYWMLDGSTESCKIGESFTVGSSSITLQPIWVANENYIIFNANNGSGEMSRQTILTDETLNLQQCMFEAPDDYYFAGWSSTLAGNVEYLDCASFFSDGTATINLYAIWEKIENL